MMNSARLAFKHGYSSVWGRGGGGACFQTPTISEYIYNTTLLFFSGENSDPLVSVSNLYATNSVACNVACSVMYSVDGTYHIHFGMFRIIKCIYRPLKSHVSSSVRPSAIYSQILILVVIVAVPTNVVTIT